MYLPFNKSTPCKGFFLDHSDVGSWLTHVSPHTASSLNTIWRHEFSINNAGQFFIKRGSFFFYKKVRIFMKFIIF